MRNLIIADRQDITRLGIQSLVRDSDIPNLGDVFVVNDKGELIKKIANGENCVVVLDYTLFDFSSITEIHILSERYPESSWILFSDVLSDSFLKQMLVDDLLFSVLLKSSLLDEIKNALQSVFAYERYLDPGIEIHMKMLKRSMEKVVDFHLTSTEIEILREMALGKTTKQIAFDRNASFHTVMTHRKNIFRKLDVNNVHEAIKYGMRAGVVDLSDYYI